MKSENWKKEFKKLEDAKNWDEALELLLKVIQENPNEKDAYIFMHYFFMNLFLEANDYDSSKYDYYESISIKYFKIAYEKYKNDAEYLFWASIPIYYGPWYFGIYFNENEHIKMMERAFFLNSKNFLYRSCFSIYIISSLRLLQNELFEKVETISSKYSLSFLIRKEKLELFIYMKEINDENSEIRKEIASKGSLGEFFLKKERFNIEESLQYKEL